MKRSGLLFLFAVILVSYMGFLLMTTYTSHNRVHQADYNAWQREVEARARTLEYFFLERKYDMKEYAASGEVTAYFFNRALGMSLEYGLQANLTAIHTFFSDVIARRIFFDEQLYTRLVLIDEDGHLLVDSRTTFSPVLELPVWPGLLPKEVRSPYMTVVETSHGPHLYVLAPVSHKNVLYGYVAAQISLDTLEKGFLQYAPADENDTVVLVGTHDFVLPRSAPFRRWDVTVDDTGDNVFSPLPSLGRKDPSIASMSAKQVLVRNSPFHLLWIKSSDTLLNHLSPLRMLGIMILLSLFVFAGMFFLFRTQMRNEALITHIREARIREKAIKRKNVQLHEEIDERKKAEERAAKANAAKDLFIARMSHELRTPLHGILGMSGMLSKTALSPRQERMNQTVLRSSRVLLGIINNLLDLSRCTTGALKLDIRAFNLQELLDDIVDLFSLEARAKGISLTCCTVSPLPLRSMGDPDRLRQILVNLVSNALKFTSQGSIRIDVEASRRGDAWGLLFAVFDTGIGVASEGCARIFEPFRQVDDSMKRKYGGLGLGLTISKELVEMMGGAMHFTSVLGEGSRCSFRIVLDADTAAEEKEEIFAEKKASISPLEPPGYLGLPVSPPSSGTDAEGDVRISSPTLPCPAILLVEDNPVNQEVAVDALEYLGFDADVASNGQEGVEAVARKTYDLIFMDCQMPVMDGYEATKKIREYLGVPGRNIPIVAMTAHALPADRARCLSVGMDDHLSKPFSLEDLQACLVRWLPAGSFPESFVP